MKKYDWTRYLSLCMGYRIITVLLSSLAYLLMIMHDRTPGARTWIIAAGMVAACLLGNGLYQEMENQKEKGWMKITIAIEMFANGIFIFLSGGISSPYLWYCLGCLLIMMTTEKKKKHMILGIGWCVLCAVTGSRGNRLSFEGMNLVLGLLGVVGGFFIIGSYIRQLQQQKETQLQLNLQLEEEKGRSEHALGQVTNLYESINLFGMTDQNRILEELSGLLNRTIAGHGCVILLVNPEGQIRYSGVSGFSKELAEGLVGQASDFLKENENHEQILEYEGKKYALSRMGGEIWNRPVFIRPLEDKKEAEEEDYYRRLIEIIFRNLEVQEQMERFIALEEQNRIANEIHDTVIQKLFGMSCTLKMLEMAAGQPQSQMQEKIRLLRETAEKTMAELRQTIYGRRFENADDSLINCLKNYMEEMKQLSGAEITMRLDQRTEEMSAAQKIAVYRIVCEAVNNAIRHGNAAQVEIDLEMKEQEVEAGIRDDGTGFVTTKERSGGNGLRNMNQLAALLKGRLVLETAAGQGTWIRLQFPR